MARRRAMAILFAICIAAPAPLMQGAKAEGLFDFLFGDDSHEAGPAPAPSARQTQRHAPRRDDARRRDAAREKHAGGASKGEQWGGGAYCVRACDGYFFPLIRSSRATGQQSCEFLCPSGQVELYRGPSIEQARNVRGQSYSALPTAFSFRDKTTEKCSCTDPQASASFFAETARSDPTLRSGDVVVDSTGPSVFNGTNLVTLNRASFVSAPIRQRLRALLQKNVTDSAASAAAEPNTRPGKEEKPMEAHGAIEFGAPSATQ